MGTFTGARKYVLIPSLDTQRAHEESASHATWSAVCARCAMGKRLRPLRCPLKFEGYDISEISQMTLAGLQRL